MGEVLQTQWSGFPVFIRRLDKADRNTMLAEPKANFRDKSDPWQKEEEILVLNAKCTHLGCIPNPNQGHYGGWFCGCHNSCYDKMGRIMSGPAPANLRWLDHSVIDNNIVVIEDSPVTFRWRQIGDMPTHNDGVI